MSGQCQHCGADLNPAAVMVYGRRGPCARCTRAIHREAQAGRTDTLDRRHDQ
jgi:formamidopyrimidine-DNA glycosylase